jgi:two-component system response regulator DevR
MSAAEKKRVRVLLVDDSEVVRMGLRSLLGGQTGIEIIGEAGNVATAVDTCAKLRPDVVLMDIRLPDGTGFDACRQILARQPDMRVLILTSVVDDTLVAEAIRAGVQGYLLKEINGRELVQAIFDVAAGQSILDPAATARVMRLVKSTTTRDLLATLSPQESRVLALIAQGCTNKEAASSMGLTEKTVKNYLSTVFEKLGINRRSQAAALYAQERPADLNRGERP